MIVAWMLRYIYIFCEHLPYVKCIFNFCHIFSRVCLQRCFSQKFVRALSIRFKILLRDVGVLIVRNRHFNEKRFTKSLWQKEKKNLARGHPDLNQGPLDLQSNALPLSYTPLRLNELVN